MKSNKTIYIIQIAFDTLCAILFSLCAVLNYLAGNTIAMILNIICVACWTFCTIFNSIILSRIIKRERNNER